MCISSVRRRVGVWFILLMALLVLSVFTGCFAADGKRCEVSEQSLKQRGKNLFSVPLPGWRVPKNWRWMGERDFGLEWDLYFTWEDGPYPLEDKFIVNGIEVGRGDEGFKRVLAEICKLPKGATVLMYPDYSQDARLHPSGPGHEWPFDMQRLTKLIEETGIDFVSSSNAELILLRKWHAVRHTAGK